MANCRENEFDDITNKLLSGEITNEAAAKLANNAESTSRYNSNELPSDDSGTIEYTPTESFLEYSIDGNCLHIDTISSGQERQGGCSYLLLEVEEMSRDRNISYLELDVMEMNHAMEIYKGKGYIEIKREHIESNCGALVTMRKEI